MHISSSVDIEVAVASAISAVTEKDEYLCCVAGVKAKAAIAAHTEALMASGMVIVPGDDVAAFLRFKERVDAARTSGNSQNFMALAAEKYLAEIQGDVS